VRDTPHERIVSIDDVILFKVKTGPQGPTLRPYQATPEEAGPNHYEHPPRRIFNGFRD
jgi:hypothetical protein